MGSDCHVKLPRCRQFLNTGKVHEVKTLCNEQEAGILLAPINPQVKYLQRLEMSATHHPTMVPFSTKENSQFAVRGA
jgi:hypothetical protein